MRKREGMEAFKLSIPSRFFTTKKCIFSIRRMEILSKIIIIKIHKNFNTILCKIRIELQKKVLYYENIIIQVQNGRKT